MPEPEQKKRNYEINQVLKRILDQNPRIVPGRIELFTEVYYPIAILEIEMKETTFENFDLIPLSVLRFVDGGVRDADGIAGIMGLSPGYVQKILDLLMGYGYLSEDGLTALGRRSLDLEQKISRNTVKQRFQADALTGELLRSGQQLLDIDLLGKDRTSGGIAHMPHIEGIFAEDLSRQFREGNLMDYKRYQGEILNANVEEITDIRCVELQYVKAYLVKLQSVPVPLIITNQYDASRKEFKERFAWQPVRVPHESAYTEYGFDRSIELYRPEAVRAVRELYRLVCEQIVDVNREKVEEVLRKIYPFDLSTMDISTGRLLDGVPEQILVYVNDTSFTVWNPFVFQFLLQYDMDSGYLFTHSRLMGLFVRFESQNPRIRKASRALKKAVRHHGRERPMSYLREHLMKNGKEGACNFEQFLDVLARFEGQHTDE